MHIIKHPLSGTAKKTTFSLSEQAVDDVQYITEKQQISTRFLVEHLCSLLEKTPPPAAPLHKKKSDFIALVCQNIETNKTRLCIKKSWSVGQVVIETLKKLAKKNGTSRNALLDAAIRTYRQFIDYEHPVAQADLKGLKSLLDDLNSGAIFEKYGITMHTYLAPLSSPVDEILHDQIITGIEELADEVNQEHHRVFGDDSK